MEERMRYRAPYVQGGVRSLVDTIIQPDILLPEQFYETQRNKYYLEPEKKLMLAVLEDAIKCFQKYVRARDTGGKSLFRDAEKYILQQDSDWLFSFENICEVSELDPSYVREGLMRWKEKKLSKSSSAYAKRKYAPR